MKLDTVWSCNRHDEDARFAKFNKLKNRRLLWHGTNVAVVAAILKSGLRIMPHSGGRVSCSSLSSLHSEMNVFMRLATHVPWRRYNAGWCWYLPR